MWEKKLKLKVEDLIADMSRERLGKCKAASLSID